MTAFECRTCGRRAHTRGEWLHMLCPCGDVMRPTKPGTEARRQGEEKPVGGLKSWDDPSIAELGRAARASLGTSGPERAGREGDSQPMPTVNDAPDVQAAVIADIEKRRELGIRRYGTALQPHNGRNALLDAYEEAIDLAMYLKQRLIEDGTA